MLYCPKCQQLEATTPQKHDDGTVTYLCRKCGGAIPLRRDLRPGEVVAGFEIEEELGRGAMGIVYQARQTNLDREVAIKILSDDSASDEVYVERFFREARAAASLSHPNVVQAYDAGVTEDGIYYFVMEKITGENLELVLNNVGPLNIPQALDVFISVANALSYAWTRNQLSHGDIKPENIIMRLNGKVKLADFGLARRAKDPELDEDIRATPAYAPPEIINGDKDVPGFKSDMYSFGATAYHILIGHEPFVGTDPVKVCAMQLSDIQTPLSELNPNIPKRLSDLVDALMEKDPANRPATWSDVVDELKDIQRGLNVDPSASKKAEKAGTGRVPVQPARKRFPVWAIAVAAVLLIAVAAVIAFSMNSKMDEPGKDVSPADENRPSSSQADPASGGKTEPASVHDEAFYQARWRMIQEESRDSGLELKQLEKFVAEAGAKAPAEAVEVLAGLRIAEQQSRALTLRNELLDRAAAFKPEDAADMDFDALDALYSSIMSKRNELTKLDAGLSEHIYLPEHKEKIDAFVKLLSDLQLAVSLGGEISTGTTPEQTKPEQKPAPSAQTNPETKTEPGKTKPETKTETKTEPSKAESGKTEPEKVAGTTMDSKLLMNYLLLLDYLPGVIQDESKSAEALRLVNELLADKAFTDEIPRKNCLGIRKFLVLNSAPMLPYLDEDEKALHGMKLFPRSYPDSVLVDISGTTFRLKIQDEKANIMQRTTWNQLRRDEGEDRIVVTLINSPQLSKLSEEFREYLYARALFLGVDPEVLKNRFDRASGLSGAKLEELGRLTEFFRESLLDEED